MAEWYFHKPGKDCVIASAEILYAAHASGSIDSVIAFLNEMLPPPLVSMAK